MRIKDDTCITYYNAPYFNTGVRKSRGNKKKIYYVFCNNDGQVDNLWLVDNEFFNANLGGKIQLTNTIPNLKAEQERVRKMIH